MDTYLNIIALGLQYKILPMITSLLHAYPLAYLERGKVSAMCVLIPSLLLLLLYAYFILNRGFSSYFALIISNGSSKCGVSFNKSC